MKYLLSIILITTMACQVNFNLFPKFEGKKKNDPANVTSISPQQWKSMAEIAVPKEPQQVKAQQYKYHSIGSDVAEAIYPEPWPRYSHRTTTGRSTKLPKIKDLCQHLSIVATKQADECYECSCWNCGTIYECTITEK